MTLAPRFLVQLIAAWRVARFGRRLRVKGRDRADQAAAFAARMAAFEGTAFGREHGLGADTDYATFRERVPVRTYEQFKPLILRMAAGEADVLVPGRCRLFVESAGATAFQAKLLPVPEAMLAHFQHGLAAVFFHYALRTGRKDVFLGRTLHLGTSTALREANGAACGTLDGILAQCLGEWTRANLYALPPAVARLPEGAAKITAAASAVRAGEVTVIGGAPATLEALAAAVREAAASGQPTAPTLQAIWPKLQCCLFSGAPLGLFAKPLREVLGPEVNFHEVYAGIEGILAAQDEKTGGGLRLLTDAGIFLEFLPLSEYHEPTLAQAGGAVVPLDKVKPGTDYVPLLTTPAGLCRYATGDIVRFVSVAPPRLHFVGRAALQLNAFGEHVSEHQLQQVLLSVCARNGWRAVNFHVAPYERRVAAGQIVQCHEWWLELHTHTVKTPTANVLGPEFDGELATRNRDYAALRNARKLAGPQIRLVIPGVFEQWAADQDKTASASKMPRCRSDRLIADQLAALTRFHQVTIAPFVPEGAP